MFDIDIWQEIFSTIRKNKLRTFLTGFSVAWGIFMLMVLLGSGNGLQNGVKDQFSDSAENIMWLWSGQTSIPYRGLSDGRQIRFRNDDYDFLLDKASGVDQVSARFYLPGNMVFSYGKEYGSFSTSACYPALKDMDKIQITSGRFINEMDIRDFRKSIVIGSDIRKALFKDEDPLGKYVNIGTVPFVVVGIFHDPRSQDNRYVYMPFTTAQKIYGGGDRVHNFVLTTDLVTTDKEADRISDGIREQMAQRHNFDPADRRAMGSYSMLADYLRTMKIFQAIKMFVWIIGIGTLIAGIVGVSNIMLILVKERTRELGIRKALGASPRSVVGLVLLESIFITTIAGYIGLVLGVGIMELLNTALDYMADGGGDQLFFKHPTVDFGTAVAATVILVVSGAIAGYIPARRAANVKPVEALKNE
ncbi:MAG: ABC transporter permease [Prolixibacteraceae bacterium]|nr:ABC transporter permease [Prolixibacteraceae bacterium]